MSKVMRGAFSQMSCFHIEQHKYAGGGAPGHGGFIEALYVVDAPEDKVPFVVYNHLGGMDGVENDFAEFDTLENAIDAHERSWSAGSVSRMKELWSTCPGFIRVVECGSKLPWFYAKHLQSVKGDIAEV